MWKLLGKIFGSKKVIDSSISGIDKIFFTNEEKADTHLKFLAAYEPFKLAQRLLALIVVGAYILVFLCAAGLMIWGGIAENEVITKTSADLIKLENDSLGWALITILAFYFAGGTVNAFKDMKKRQK